MPEMCIRDRYQTVYAKELGSAAAPTAGLHFTPELMDTIRAKGVNIAEVTLQMCIRDSIWSVLCSKKDGMDVLSIFLCGMSVFLMPVWRRSNRQQDWMLPALYRRFRWP